MNPLKALGLAALLVVTGCAGGSSLPPAGGDTPAVVGSAASAVSVSTTSIRHGNDTVTLFGSSICGHPKFPTVCVQQGQYVTLGIQETCGKSKAACGHVKWSTTTSNKGITAYFEPNPGDPTSEIVMAFIEMKPGRYSQTIKIDCSKDKNCVKYPLKATVYVLKYGGGKH